MTVSELLGVLGSVFGILLVVGGATAFLKVGSVRELRAVNSDLREERDDWKGRYESELEERVALGHRVDDLEAEDRRSKLALARIGEQALGTADIRELAAAMRDLVGLAGAHDKEAARRHAQTTSAIRSSVTAIVGLRNAVEGRRDPTPPEVPQ